MNVVSSIILCLLHMLSVLSRGGLCGAPLRTVGGRDARDGEFPYVVRMEVFLTEQVGDYRSTQRHHLCTASMLSPTASLTAGHCCTGTSDLKNLLKSKGSLIEVQIVIRYGGSGTGRPSDSDRFSDVLSCARPPSQRPRHHPAVTDDLALLTTQPVTLPAYARLSALDYRQLFGQRVSVLGYGNTNSSDGTMQTTLQLKMPLQVLDSMWNKCDLGLPVDLRIVTIPYPLVCAVGACGRYSTACSGDSGGPVLHASGVVGVNSMAFTAANCQMRTDKTRINVVVAIMPLSTRIDWIADTMVERLVRN